LRNVPAAQPERNLIPKYVLVTEKNCEMRAQLLVDTRIRQAGASIAIVSIATCWSGVVARNDTLQLYGEFSPCAKR
jgi:hypothetical protein